MNLTRNYEVVGLIPGLASVGYRSSVAMRCVGCTHGLDLALLWLWHRLAATAPIRPLGWEPPHAMGVALKRQKTKTLKKKCVVNILRETMTRQKHSRCMLK